MNQSPDNLADATERVGHSVIGIGSQRRQHAAACVWKSGMVVTTATAVWRSPKVRLVMPDGESTQAEVRGVDTSTDLAVIAADTASVPAVERRIDLHLRAGDAVFAVGRELSGLLHASYGRVGAAAGEWRTWRGARVDRLIRLDGGLYPGLQGAPVADALGQVVGVASGALSRSQGVVLPIATVDRVAAQLMEHGRVARGYLGIAMQAAHLAEPVRKALGTQSDTGLLVHSVADDGPAAAAGVAVGDIIVAAGGAPMTSALRLSDALAAGQIGSRLRLTLARGGQPVELSVEVAERNASACR